MDRIERFDPVAEQAWEDFKEWIVPGLFYGGPAVLAFGLLLVAVKP
jgi:hypothetical protein